MTITLTVEEVKNYVSAMEHWQSLRANEIIRVLSTDKTLYLDRSSIVQSMMLQLPKWDAANPMPTLLSTHFGALVPKVTEQQKQPIKG